MFTMLLSLLFIIRLKLNGNYNGFTYFFKRYGVDNSNYNGFTYFFKRYGVDGQLIYINL